MTPFTLAAAQSCSVPCKPAANVQQHLQLVQAAARHGVQWLVFPELSLCGYELAQLPSLASQITPELLQPLQDAARHWGMAITVGLPVQQPGQDRPCIAACTLHPQGAPALYCKQYLHGSEQQYARPSPTGFAPHVQALTPVGSPSLQIASAICFDSNQSAHALAAAAAGAQVYAAGVLVSPAGYGADSTLWQQAAQRHHMGVLVANHGAASGPYATAGRSACWGPDGTLLAEVPGLGEALLVLTVDGDRYRASHHAL
jgi:predicted amidohydrolase